MKTTVVGFWNYKKEKLKQKFDILTEKDLSYIFINFKDQNYWLILYH